MSGGDRSAGRARQLLATMRARLAPALRRAFTPFRAATPLTPHDRRVVAACWGAAGMLFACAWTGALALLMPGFSGARALTAGILLVVGGGLFFAAAGYALVGIGNRLITSPPPRSTAPRAPNERGSVDERRSPEP